MSYMRWTPEKVAQLRELAPTGIGGPVIAAAIGTTLPGVNHKAGELGIPIVRGSVRSDSDSLAAVRARWRARIGPMKERLRAEIAMEMGQ